MFQLIGNPSTDKEVSNKKYVDDSIQEGSILRFDQTLQNDLKMSVGQDTFNLTRNDKIPITNTTIKKSPNSGGYLLQNWNINCNDKKRNGKIQTFVKSTKTNSSTGDSGAIQIPPICDSFMYKETSSINSGSDDVFLYFREN